MKNNAIILGLAIIFVNIGLFFSTACAGYKECSPIKPIPSDMYVGSISATMIPSVTDVITSPTASSAPTVILTLPIEVTVPMGSNLTAELTPTPTDTTPYLTPQEIAVQEAPFTGRGGSK